jgi:hypothetical protein
VPVTETQKQKELGSWEVLRQPEGGAIRRPRGCGISGELTYSDADVELSVGLMMVDSTVEVVEVVEVNGVKL